MENDKHDVPIPLGVYRHYKGNMYEVVGHAKHSEMLEEMVIYKALYGEGGTWEPFCQDSSFSAICTKRLPSHLREVFLLMSTHYAFQRGEAE